MNGSAQSFNYGRRIPASPFPEHQRYEEPAPAPQQVQQPAPQPSAPEKKPGMFDKPVTSRELFTEINLFVPQVIGAVISILFAVIAIVIIRVMSIGWAEGIKNTVSEEVYNSLAANLNTFNTLFMVSILIPVLIYVGFLLVKWLFMMPRKDRFLHIRLFKSNAMLFTIEPLKQKLLFNPKDKKTEVMLADPNKHYDYLNGRSVVCFREEDRTNISFQKDLDTSGKGRDTDSLVSNALHTGYEIAREQLTQREDKTKLILILLIVVLAAVALVGFGVMSTPDRVASAVIGALKAATGTGA